MSRPAVLRAQRPEPARWTHVELRAITVGDGPSVGATVDGFAALARRLGIGDHPLEEIWAAAVDGHHVRSMALVARGLHRSTPVAVPAVLAIPLLAGTERLVLLHTHPAAPLVPSAHDLALTRTVAAAANACGLLLDDHLIVGRRGAMTSLRALGYLG